MGVDVCVETVRMDIHKDVMAVVMTRMPFARARSLSISTIGMRQL